MNPPVPDAREFGRLAPVTGRALAYTGGTHTMNDLWDALSAGKLQMWTRGDSVIITEVQQYPRMRAVHFFLAAGNMNEIEQLVPDIETWARDIGASRVTLAGRKGWERTFLAGRGYAPQWSVMSKRISDV